MWQELDSCRHWNKETITSDFKAPEWLGKLGLWSVQEYVLSGHLARKAGAGGKVSDAASSGGFPG